MTVHPRRARIVAVTRAPVDPRLWLFGAAIVGAGALWAGSALSESHETIITTHGYSTFGDLLYPADYPHLNYVNPDAPKGGEISISAQGTFNSMNPYSLDGNAGALSTVGYETLLSGTADEVSAEYCLLCTSLEYPESEDWVIFHMNPAARFSDGTPVTAHDVVFSHYLLLEQGVPSYASVVAELIPTVEALDDYTVKFTFGVGVPRKNLINQAGGTPVWSRAWYESTGARLDESRMEISPGSGPYVLDSFDAGRQIIYRRNPDYWGADLPIMQGRANFDTIRVEYFADSTAAFEAFKAGEYTFRQESSSIQWATGYDFPALDSGWVVKSTLPSGSLPGATGPVFNLLRERFQDVRVRQAIALMYNFTWTNESLQFSLFSQRESFWQGSDLQAVGVPEGRELELLQTVADQIDPAILTETVTVPHTSSPDQIDRANLRLAIDLMEAAGWVPGDDGLLRNAAGETFPLEFMMDNPSFERILVPYVDNLRTLGIDAQFNLIDPAQYTVRERDFDFDMIFKGYTNGLEEGIGIGQRFGTDGLGDVFNPASYTSPAVDILIEAVIAAETQEEMAAAVRAIDRIMRREVFVIPVWYNPNFWVAHYDMFEHPAELPPYALGQLDFWWFNADKAAELAAAGAFQ